LTEIHLCHACSCHEIEDGNGRAGIAVIVSLLGSSATPVQLAGVDAVKEIARHEPNQLLLAAAGAIPLLLELARAGSSHSVQVWTTGRRAERH
jgi:hypothetical protein